jgi:hypothetical protein
MTDIAFIAAISDLVDTIIPVTETVTPSDPVFWVDTTNVRFHPKRGFEQALASVLADGCPRTPAEIVTALLASGEYHRVAPQAANLRPARPVNFLLRTWSEAGLIRRSA